MLDALRSVLRKPRPSGPPQLIKRFEPGDQTVTGTPLETEGDGWHARLDQEQTLRLFAYEPPPLDPCILTYRAELKTEDLIGQAYLEMLVRFPGPGEFFSKGLHDTVSGSNRWASYEVPFYLKDGQVPDLLKLNLVVEGRGQIWVRAVELDVTPLR